MDCNGIKALPLHSSFLKYILYQVYKAETFPTKWSLPIISVYNRLNFKNINKFFRYPFLFIDPSMSFKEFSYNINKKDPY